MSGLRRSEFPNLLLEYAPDRYQQYTPQKSVQRFPSVSTSNSGTRTRSRVDPNLVAVGKTAKKWARLPSPTLRAPSREHTFDFMKRQEVANRKRNFVQWERAKVDHRDDRLDALRRKIFVQQRLIASYDELARTRLEEQRLQEKQLRENEREAKKKQIDELEKVCKESIDGDLKAKKKAHHLEKREEKIPSQRSGNVGQEAKITSSCKLSGSSSPSLLSHHPVPQNSPLAEGDEEEKEEDGEDAESSHVPDQVTDDIRDRKDGELPWHHEQLYQLYGRQADYFLYPKMEEKEKKRIKLKKPMQSKLAKIHAGRSGASELWNALRAESKMRMADDDKSVPSELKDAYGAFIRECLTNPQRQVKHNFYKNIPEMARLLDKSVVNSVRDYKHKVELMFRASGTNEDRSKILMHNNPIPNLNNWEGEESVSRYLPSWMDTVSLDDSESIASYKKWIQSRRNSGADGGEGRPNTADSAASKGDQWDFLRLYKRDKKVKKPQYIFLTEAEARCPGEFTARHLEAAEHRLIPQAYKPAGREGASVMAMADDESARSTLLQSDFGTLRSQSCLSPQTFSRMSQRRPSNWQPLSMSALLEYKLNMPTSGEGGFKQGSVPVWMTQSVQ